MCDSIAHALNPSTFSRKCNYHYSYKPLTKQKSEEELKDKNQLLEAVNKQLHKKLTETQVRDPPISTITALDYMCRVLRDGPLGGSKFVMPRYLRGEREDARFVLWLSKNKGRKNHPWGVGKA